MGPNGRYAASLESSRTCQGLQELDPRWRMALGMRRGLLLAAGVGLVLAAPASSAGQYDTIPAPLVGYVLDSHGIGVPGVCISTMRAHGLHGKPTVSGAGGKYRLETTAIRGSDSYYFVWLSPCQTSRNVAPEYFSHSDGYESERTLTVRVIAGRSRRQDFPLRTSATIEGVVTDVLGRPAAGLCVETDTFGSNADSTTVGLVSQAVTDALGHYRLIQLVADAHDVAVRFNCDPNSLLAPISLGHGTVSLHEGQTAQLNLRVPGQVPG